MVDGVSYCDWGPSPGPGVAMFDFHGATTIRVFCLVSGYDSANTQVCWGRRADSEDDEFNFATPGRIDEEDKPWWVLNLIPLPPALESFSSVMDALGPQAENHDSLGIMQTSA
eukprot:gnl/TRDRNA2_/TRDRNA2_83031_c0_seq1.p1 gnl/TRDRNA2_/TRDRNA2_83031_c0~~gnl/TRDRNA2_/TRDRNA2_83031_c0_seq1.p1  ORF type:complete len:113 (-),score=13.16 gnl/TRDRNA2_/TRDRNA2_83031_c0_seq1:120-458(-)